MLFLFSISYRFENKCFSNHKENEKNEIIFIDFIQIFPNGTKANG
jgi:hypothetical protein